MAERDELLKARAVLRDMNDTQYNMIVAMEKEVRALKSDIATLNRENERLCTATVAARQSAQADQFSGAWYAVVEALGPGWVDCGGRSGTESAVNCIKKLRRKAAKLDAVCTALDSPQL